MSEGTALNQSICIQVELCCNHKKANGESMIISKKHGLLFKAQPGKIKNQWIPKFLHSPV